MFQLINCPAILSDLIVQAFIYFFVWHTIMPTQRFFQMGLDFNDFIRNFLGFALARSETKRAENGHPHGN